MDLRKSKDPTPFGLIEWVENKFKTKSYLVPSHLVRGNVAISHVSVVRGHSLIPMNFEKYSQLDPEKRFCAWQNPTGIRKTVKDMRLKSEALLKGDSIDNKKKICLEVGESWSKRINLINACATLEEQVEFTEKAKLNKEIVKTQDSPKASELTHATKKLEEVRRLHLEVLLDISREMENIHHDKVLSDEEYLKDIDNFGKSAEGKKYIAELVRAMADEERLNAQISELFIEEIRRRSGPEPIAVINEAVNLEKLTLAFLNDCKMGLSH